MRTTVILIGPPGSGKTACGLALAALLGWRFVDTDCLIEEQTGTSVEAIFREKGEPFFRNLERAVIAELAQSANEALVVGTGGGLPVFHGNMDRLKALGTVIYLTASLPALVDRVIGQGQRPLLACPQGLSREQARLKVGGRLRRLIRERTSVYEQAHLKVDTTETSPAEAAEEIAALLRLTPERR